MSDTANWMVHDHRKYDAVLDECEVVAGVGEWKTAIQLFNTFVDDLKLHMRMEDDVLYPVFQEEAGDPEGDIAALTEEHDDIVRLLSDLAYIIKSNDFDHFLESLVPLHKAMTHHNEHEEAVFQSMGSDSLLMRRAEIIDRLNEMQNKEGQRNWNF